MSMKVSASGRSGNSQSICMPRCSPTSAGAAISGLLSPNIKNICAVHTPTPGRDTSCSITASSSHCASCRKLSLPSSRACARPLINRVLAAESPTLRHCCSDNAVIAAGSRRDLLQADNSREPMVCAAATDSCCPTIDDTSVSNKSVCGRSSGQRGNCLINSEKPGS